MFAVYRGIELDHSFHLVDIVNAFGRAGGFKALIARLTNHSPHMPVAGLLLMLWPLSRCYLALSRATAALDSVFLLLLHTNSTGFFDKVFQ